VDIGLIPAGHNTVRIIEIKERSSVPTEAALDRRDTDLRQCAGLAVLLKHPDDRETAQRGRNGSRRWQRTAQNKLAQVVLRIRQSFDSLT